MKVVVTGGTGFIGLAVAEALIAQGHSVTLFGAAPIPDRIAAHPALGGARILAGDVRSAEDLAGAIGAGTDVLIHGAAITPDAAMEAERPGDVVSVNVGGTVAALEAAGKAGVGRVVVLSSVAVYGNGRPLEDGAVDELAPPCPSTLYGITKLAAEQTAFRLAALWSLDVRAVRLGPAFGPWEYQTGLRPTLSPPRQILDQALATRRCVLSRPVFGDFIYSRDAAEAILEVATRETLPHTLFNLGGATRTLSDWCALLASAIPGFEWGVDENRATFRPSLAQDRAVLDSRRIETALGPVQHRLPQQELRETIRWLEETT